MVPEERTEKLKVIGEYSGVPVLSPTGKTKVDGDAGKSLLICPAPSVTIIAATDGVPKNEHDAPS